MASIDQLQIEIQASSAEATRAINNLVSSLKNLNRQLGLADGTKLSTVLSKIADNFERISNVSDSVGNSINSSVEKAASSMSELSKSAQEATTHLEELRKAGASGDVDSSIEKMLPALQSIESASLQVSQNFERMLPAIRESTTFQPPDLSTSIAQFNEYEQSIQRGIGNVKSLEQNIKQLTDKFYEPIDTTGEWVNFQPPDLYTAIQQYTALGKAAEYAYEQMQKVGIGTADNSVPLIGMDDYIDTTGEFVEEFDNDASDIESIARRIWESIRNAFKPQDVSNNDLLANVVALGEALEKLGSKFEALGDKAAKLFTTMATPLRMVAEEYKEKIEHIGSMFTGLVAHVRSSLAKMAAFWKRAMRTFTFMLVRKAITAIIKEVSNAVKSLALFSDAMGTQFNNSISLLVADFQYLGRSIVSVFAPLIDFIAPIIDAIVDKIATLLSYIGMLMAALTGASAFTKAKKNVGNYAKSLDGASKSAKNLTMGIDELNILAENKGGGSSQPYDDWADAWENVDIPAWIKDIADWLKDFWDRFFAPLLEAWNRAKQYLIDGFKTMMGALGRMFGHIVDDFLTMWNQEKTIHMFEQILRIVGDLFRVVRNLADQFDKAWQKGKVGLKIFENLRDIFSILVEHARNVSYYMIDWAKEIDFYPMLEAFEQLTKKLKRPAEFIGGIFEDIMKNGVLKYVEFTINDAIPHLLETLGKISDSFGFETLREKLSPVWTAIEETLERIHTGVTNAIGNLGTELGRFVNSDEFAKFLERLVEISKEITSARVEKILTGIGEGILAIIEAIVKFVNSDAFIKFIQALGKWIDQKSTKEIAGILEKIAMAIVGFKFTGFALSKMAGFFKFFTVIIAMKNLTAITNKLLGVSKGTDAVAKSVSLLNSPVSALKTMTTGTTTMLSKIVTGLKNLATGFLNFHNTISPVTATVGSIVAGFLEFKAVSSDIKDVVAGTKSLDDTIGNLAISVGVASAAFTLLLGFPAGIIAAGVVAAIAAIKGVADAAEQINFDHMMSAVMTQGDTTIAQVREWYDQATNIVSENTQKWIDIERNLTQNRGDIDAYSKSLEGLNIALDENVRFTVDGADKLTGKYEDLSNAVSQYLDASTDAIVQNILAQRAFLEAQGVDVDAMIANIYKGIDEEQKVISEATAGVRTAFEEYQKAIEEHGDDSNEAISKWNEYVTAVEKAGGVLEAYQSQINEFDTSSAVNQMTTLGHSLDFSEYEVSAEGLENLKTDLTTAIQGIQTTYSTEMDKVNKVAEDKKKELDAFMAQHPGLISPENQAKILSGIERDAQEQRDTLTKATGDALDYFNNELNDKMGEVAEKAAADWDSWNWFEKMMSGSTSKAEYIQSQTRNYADEIFFGSGGVEGVLTDAYKQVYENIPGAVAPNIEASLKAGYDTLRQGHIDNLEDVLGVVDTLDYDTSSGIYANKTFSALENSLNGLNYRSLGQLWNTETGNAIVSETQILEDSNRLAANDGAAAFSQEYVDFLSDNQAIISTMEETGSTYGGGLIEGLNKKVAEDMSTTEPVLYEWFRNISNWIHDNPFAKFGSPNLKTKEYGGDLVKGLNIGIDESRTTTKPAIERWFALIKGTIVVQLREVKTQFNEGFTEIFAGKGIDVNTTIGGLFTQIKSAVQKNLDALGTELMSNSLPVFMQTYILPFFNTDMWQPLFDNLMTIVFIPAFDRFIVWFDETMATWWDEHMLIWFAADKWDEDIFTPLAENIHEHFATFSSWWDATMLLWWNSQVEPWFEKDLWIEIFNHVLEATKEVFKKINDAMQENILEAKDVVLDACVEMQEAIGEILEAIGEIVTMLGDLGAFKGKMTFEFGGGKFASGGFPDYGSLFIAGEAGPELVGNIHGRTGVVSNGEITGIEDAVYATGSAETELLSQLISITRAMLDKEPVVIGDRDIARMANSGQSKLGMSIIS